MSPILAAQAAHNISHSALRTPHTLRTSYDFHRPFWFINREKQGLKTNWPKDSAYQQFATQDLLQSVTAVLEKYRRWTL